MRRALRLLPVLFREICPPVRQQEGVETGTRARFEASHGSRITFRCPSAPTSRHEGGNVELAVRAVWSEPVSGGWASNSLLNREKTGNFSESGRYGGISVRINSSNQWVSHKFPKNWNREFNWRIREFSRRNREFGSGSSKRGPARRQVQIGGTQPPLPNFVQLAETDVNGDSPDGSPGCQR